MTEPSDKSPVTTLLINGTVVTGGDKTAVINDGAVAWQGNRITAVGTRQELQAGHADAELLDARGGLIMPGLINLHHHFYSALARGLDPGRPMTSFGEILEQLWWRLDRALDRDTVRLSAMLSVAECIRAGCTTVFDHHASPSCLRGSLDLLAAAVEQAGLRAVLCYEVSDRNGHDEALAGIEENLGLITRHRDHPRIRGMLGLHASFTVSDETLAEAARSRPDFAGCHVHVAEDRLDLSASQQRFGAGPVRRLARAGLLDARAILAHGVHLEPADLQTVAEHDAVLVHNPESNANNAVGRLDLVRAAGLGCLLGLGTDGMSSAMLRSLRAAFLGLRGGTGDPTLGFTVLPDLLWHNTLVARRFFDEPLLGRLAPAAPADLVVVDAPPPTPISAANLFGHLVYGASEATIRHTIASGRVLLRDHQLTGLDLAQLSEQARAVAPGLWQRFHSLGT